MHLSNTKYKPKTEHGKLQRKMMQERLKAAKAAKSTHPFIRWIAVKDIASCANCLALDGKHFNVADPGWKDCIPPTHEGCRCRISSARKLPDGTVVEVLSDYFNT